MRSIIEQAAAALADNLRYDVPAGKWMLWSGTHWQHDDTLAACDLVRLICRRAAFERVELEKARNFSSFWLPEGKIPRPLPAKSPSTINRIYQPGGVLKSTVCQILEQQMADRGRG
jgi:hypothetical protein